MEEQFRVKQHSENNVDGPVNIYLLQETPLNGLLSVSSTRVEKDQWEKMRRPFLERWMVVHELRSEENFYMKVMERNNQTYYYISITIRL